MRAASGKAIVLGLTAAAGALVGAPAAADDWVCFGHGADRVSVGASAPTALGTARWVRGDDGAGGGTIQWVGQAGVVSDGVRVYGVGSVGGAYRVCALRTGDGAVVWSEPVAAPYLDSWATPALDERNGAVIVASGRTVGAFDAASGAAQWQAMLDRNVVNASPVATQDLAGRNRVFITDYDGFGGAGKLYCIDADAFDVATNPFEPGQIVWSVAIGGSSGNTPAYAAGAVYVASVSDESGAGAGRVMAFDAGATEAPAPMWVAENPMGLGFFGGVCVSGGAVYAASYALAGGQTAGNLLKIDAATGAVRWSVPCNRTDGTPAPIGGGLVMVSGGLFGFGCVPSLELFLDEGGSASMLWDTALDTWHDDNGNGRMDVGEFLLVGGWTHQPAFARGRLYAGAIGAGTTSFGPCTDLYTLDLMRRPSEAGFVVEHVSGMGTTPALADGSLYAIGAAGLFAFGSPCYANCDASTAAPLLNVNDFVCFQTRFAAGDSYANCDLSTAAPVLNVNDFICFLGRFAGGCP